MKQEHIQDLISWLQRQVEFSSEIINQARETQNYGKETQYEGMREAYLKCIKKLSI